MKLVLVMVAGLLLGCENAHFVKSGRTPAETIEQKSEVELLVEEKNEFRVAAGQLPLSRGLTCTIHETTNPDLTASLGSAKHTFTLFKEFNQPNSAITTRLNILPPALQAIYLNNYAVRCQGVIVIVESGFYNFSLTSDDGSMLYINNSLLINNNGNHGAVTVSNTRLLERGVHTFRLDYGQTGGGSQALILKSNNEVMPAEVFYR